MWMNQVSRIERKRTWSCSSTRFIELDILRGFAIVAMIFLHLLWDLDYFHILPLNQSIYLIQPAIPALFFILVGVCLIVSKNKKCHQTAQEENEYYKHLALRGLKIFSLGMIITTVTLLVMPGRPVIFGVLHCIGLSIVLSVLFLRFKSMNFVFATAIVSVGFIAGLFTMENPSALHLIFGIHQADVWHYTIDYFPLLPWFGACLFGIALGNVLYKDNRRQFPFPDLSRFAPMRMCSWLGRHSLAIYLIHQPIIAGVLSVYLLL